MPYPRTIVTTDGRSLARESLTRSFAQTGPAYSCFVADQTRLHLTADGSWLLEAWGYAEGEERWFRTVTRAYASKWLRQNGYEDVTRRQDFPDLLRSARRSTPYHSFEPASDVLRDLLETIERETKDTGS